MRYVHFFARRSRRAGVVVASSPSFSRPMLIEPLEGRLLMSATVHTSSVVAPSCCAPACCVPKCCAPSVSCVQVPPICNPCCKVPVTITGCNFQPGDTVLLCSPCGKVFNETCEGNVQCITCNTIKLCTSDFACGGPGQWSVKVINCQGQASCPFNFCVTFCCENQPIGTD